MELKKARLEAGPLSTDYYCGRRLLERFDEFFEFPGRAVVITDGNVAAAQRRRLGVEADWLVVEPGEASKNLEQVSDLYRELIRLGVDRKTTVVALGGGVVGDLAGFVAATFLRGLPFIQVPTSLLAMVDSSIGGKVGVDFGGGKNLVGAFYAPQAILADLDCLETLPEIEFENGMAEVIKHAFLDGGPRLAELEGLTRPAPDLEFVFQSAGVKMEVVGRDPKEGGLRALLNFGHTLGHAIEAVSNFELAHGRAVALGMLAAVRLSRDRGLLRQDFEGRLVDLLTRWGLPTVLELELEAGEVMTRLKLDKKNRDGRVTFVLPRAPGDFEVVPGVEEAEALEVLNSLKS